MFKLKAAQLVLSWLLGPSMIKLLNKILYFPQCNSVCLVNNHVIQTPQARSVTQAFHSNYIVWNNHYTT